MSSFVKVQTEITDQELLVQALTVMGYGNVESYPEAQELVNAWGAGHGVSTAEVIVRAKDAKVKHEGGYNRSDFGFKRGPTGKFALEANDMDRRSYDSKWLAEVNANVGIAKVTRMARRQYGCATPQIRDIETPAGRKRVVTFTIPG